MKKAQPIYVIIMGIGLALVLAGCGGGEDEGPVRMQRPVRPEGAQAGPDTEAGADRTVVAEMPERNPFQSYIARLVAPKGPDVPKTPLQCCDLSAFKLQVVITGIDEPKALIKSPEGDTYQATIGTLIGTKEGRIVDITPRSIVVEEIERDIDGNVASTSSVELALPVIE